MSKQPKVPETKDVKPNRAQRRHPDKTADAPLSRDDVEAPKAADVPDPRSKSSGHGKKTADKWNQ
jgi:hypothetical protein